MMKETKELREGELEKLREGLQKRSPPFLLYLWSLNPTVLCGLSHVWSRVFSALEELLPLTVSTRLRGPKGVTSGGQ